MSSVLYDIQSRIFKNVSIYEYKIESPMLEESIERAFKQKLSTSIILLSDPSVDTKTDQLLGTYLTSLHKNIAKVNGQLVESDHEALISITNQFLLRSNSFLELGNLNEALEDLEMHLRQCRIDGIPAVILVDQLHMFAHKRERQLLLYTLLDLMHKPDMLILVSNISISSSYY